MPYADAYAACFADAMPSVMLVAVDASFVFYTPSRRATRVAYATLVHAMRQRATHAEFCRHDAAKLRCARLLTRYAAMIAADGHFTIRLRCYAGDACC